MLNICNYFKRPEYLFRPTQVLRRLRRIWKPPQNEEIVKLPWGATVNVRTHENVGRDIYFYGIFDKVVPEAIWRLLDAGETAIEIGANIGQNSLLMAARAGREGKVLAFEPHPEIFLELKANHERSHNVRCAPVQLERVALGQTNGEAVLVELEEFSYNRGSASVLSGEHTEKGLKVQLRRLDDFLGSPQRAGVCKIDVEGRELDVLKGATDILERRAIRDIVFEDFNPKPSPVTEFLTKHGFTIFELHDGWLRPHLRPLSLSGVTPSPNSSFNYLATLDPERAKKRFQPGGWQCLLCR